MRQVIALLLLLACAPAWGQGSIGGNDGGISGNNVSPTGLQSFNGWQIIFSLYDGATIVSGGTGNAVGDILTLNDHCGTHSSIVVTVVTAGAVTNANVGNPGLCVVAPSGTITVLSTTGSGSGTTVTAPYAPIGGYLIAGTLANNSGNTQVGAGQSPYFAGAESTFLGDSAGGAVGSGSYNTVIGDDAFGIGGGCSKIYMGAGTVTGTDNLRNTCGGGGAPGFDTYGDGVLKTYNQTGTSSNCYLCGIAAFGAGAMFYWNGAVSNPYDTAFGNNTCIGASSGTVNFVGVSCFGPRIGQVLTSASYSLLMGGGASGGNCAIACTTFASGTGVILIGSGYSGVDTPAAGTSNWINIENAILIATAHPNYSSGFGTSAGWSGGAGGGTSFEFGFNVGTGGTASSGVISFPTAAPNGWYCTGRDVTHPASFVEDFASTSTTTVTVQNYSRTTGATGAWTSGDVLQISCLGF